MSTTVLSLMFHRVNDAATHCDPARFSDFLNYLVNHFPIVMPDDPLPPKGLAIMLTFDDAYFDFYYTVFPLLKQHRIRALLAVPVKYIVETTSLDPTIRLSVPYPQGMENNRYKTEVPFCTWEELREMAETPYVSIASHSFSHANLADKNTDLREEVLTSKKILASKLKKNIDCFVYPYGKMSREAHQYVIQHYRYGLRIGSAINRGWDKKRGSLYRIDADFLWKKNYPIDNRLIQKLTLKYWLNRLRRK
jgi:peptidoglycan/xylan/chitin deacetylase (PgdA/CDA1 family)